MTSHVIGHLWLKCSVGIFTVPLCLTSYHTHTISKLFGVMCPASITTITCISHNDLALQLQLKFNIQKI